MDELDQAAAAVRQAAQDARDPAMRQRLDAAAAIFAALARRDAREREAWTIVRRVANMDGLICTCYHTKHADKECIVTRARVLLGDDTTEA